MEIPSFREKHRLYFTSRLFHHLCSIDSDAKTDNTSGAAVIPGCGLSSISRTLALLRQKQLELAVKM